MKIGGRKLFKTRQSAKKLTGFNSKWKPGDKLRVLYPCFRDEETGELDLLCGAVWGYPWDVKATSLKRIFVPTLSEIDEYGDPVTKDIIAQAVPMLRLVFDGQKQEAVNKIKANSRMAESARATAIDQINKDFEKKNPLARGLEYKIFTECYVIPMSPDDKPDWKNAGLVSQDLSNERYNNIVAAMNSSANYHDEKTDFFEISYAFKSDNDKADAGKVTPLGCPKDIALSCLKEEDTISKENYNRILIGANLLPDDSEVIIKRNSNSKPVPEAEIMRAISDYCATNYTALDALDGDDVFMDRLDKQLGAIRLFNVPVTIPSVVAELDKMDEEEAKAKAEAEAKAATEGNEEADAEVTDAPTIDKLQDDNRYTKEELEEKKANATDGLNDEAEANGIDINADATEV